MVELVLQFARKALLGLALLGVLLTAVGGWTFVNAYRVIDNGTTATATVLDMTRSIADERRRHGHCPGNATCPICSAAVYPPSTSRLTPFT